MTQQQALPEDLSSATPLMRQYFQIKAGYSDAVLLFQVGDFYECFFSDAKIAAETLSITLTKRGKHCGQDIPLCGVPAHMVRVHAARLVKAGLKVAICAQTEPARPGAIVSRAVTEFLTPGTLVDEAMLTPKRPSYLCSIFQGQDGLGLLFCELLTLQLFATRLPAGQLRILESELSRFFPDEVLVQAEASLGLLAAVKSRGYCVSPIVDRRALSDIPFSQGVFQRLTTSAEFRGSAEILGTYICRHNSLAIAQISELIVYDWQDSLVLDAATLANLEIVRNVSGGRDDTLLSSVDGCRTAMGSRNLCKWLLRPPVSKKTIEARQERVAALLRSSARIMTISTQLSSMPDLERIVGRLALDRARATDFFALAQAIRSFDQLSQLGAQEQCFVQLANSLTGFAALANLLTSAIDEDQSCDYPIRQGFDLELDRLRQMVCDSQNIIFQFEQAQIKKTGIEGLKVRYSDAWGYAIELTKVQSQRVPEDYKLEQTLVGRNRYSTVELKHLEAEITLAKNQISAREGLVWAEVKAQVGQHILRLQRASCAVAEIDTLFGLAWTAWQNNWIRPEVSDAASTTIEIEDGRHPVVERKSSGRFVPNSVKLNQSESVWLVTGPNMGGKSTFLRQVAQICLLAHVGSFVPAKSAKISILDRIFTRIGAGDNLAAGKSTFLIEMEEAATICRDATAKSLVIMDEVGRGTSASEGLAIAHALVSFIRRDLGSLCLFATHYHELSDLEVAGVVKNYSVRARVQGEGLLFMHKVVPGPSLSSFGVEVARMAGLPGKVVDLARGFLQDKKSTVSQSSSSGSSLKPDPSIFTAQAEVTAGHEVIKLLSDIQMDELSPRQAHELLSDLIGKIRQG